VLKSTKNPELGDNPYVEIDGRKISNEEFLNYDPNMVAVLTVYDGKEAIEKYGDKGKDGVLIVTSKNLARDRFHKFFASVSSDYEKVKLQYDDTDIQYILNKKILDKNYEGGLSLIAKNDLKSITIVQQEELIDKYNIKDKKIGVIIRARMSKN